MSERESLFSFARRLRYRALVTRCRMTGHDWKPSEYHDEGQLLDVCVKCWDVRDSGVGHENA